MSITFGVALSGGGARGIAHIGVLAALEKHGIYPEVVSGTSMGSIVGMFYAYGYKPTEILDIFKTEKNFKTFFQTFSIKGFLKLRIRFGSLLRYIPENDFRCLKKKLYISVANLNQGCNELRSEGKLFEFVLASCAIPLVFPAQVIGETTYVDGGLFNNLPAEILENKCDRIIGSHVNHNARKTSFRSSKQIA